ncbi:hypothetical protein N9954_00640 [Maribacter sp.]|nr:hypothetical protein [Maribacter sp.]
MILTEINPKGKFDTWDEAKLNEVKSGGFSQAIGDVLYENEEIRLWEILLKPAERIPFRSHRNNYSCTSFTDGLLVSRNIDGQIVLVRIKKGGTLFWESKGGEVVHDLENVGETTVKIAIVEEKLKMSCEISH